MFHYIQNKQNELRIKIYREKIRMNFPLFIIRVRYALFMFFRTNIFLRTNFQIDLFKKLPLRMWSKLIFLFNIDHFSLMNNTKRKILLLFITMNKCRLMRS